MRTEIIKSVQERKVYVKRHALNCGELIKRLNDILGKCVNNELKNDNMTASQIKMLIIISETDNECITLKELEKHFGVAQATIAGTVARLEKKDMIESFYESCDKRVKHVRLTSKGKNICKHAYNGMLKREEWFLSSLDNEEKKELQRLLQKIYDNTSNDKSYSRQTTANH